MVVAKQVVAMYDENYGSIVAFVDSGVENIVTTFLLEVGLETAGPRDPLVVCMF